MKLSISNIAWNKENDEEMYKYLSSVNVDALEIAPTRIIEKNPYGNIEEAKLFADRMHKKYNLLISSIQSIWYGRQEKIFGNKNEREVLIRYTKQAIDFASAIKCRNIVFGCPKNRVINGIDAYDKVILDFFNEIGDYAISKNTCFAIEPNPVIYNTNFINTTNQAIELIKKLNNPGIKLNLDLGTMLYNNEDLKILNGNIGFINHVHISEPNLEYIVHRKLHIDLLEMLKNNYYKGYISIEMKNYDNIQKVKDVIDYVKSIRG